jgi:hypothetical protein
LGKQVQKWTIGNVNEKNIGLTKELTLSGRVNKNSSKKIPGLQHRCFVVNLPRFSAGLVLVLGIPIKLPHVQKNLPGNIQYLQCAVFFLPSGRKG